MSVVITVPGLEFIRYGGTRYALGGLDAAAGTGGGSMLSGLDAPVSALRLRAAAARFGRAGPQCCMCPGRDTPYLV